MQDREFDRMRWAARRGMLELDLVLEPFVKNCYMSLSSCDREVFQRLMLSEDQDLFVWFMRRGQPDDEELNGIVKKILAFTFDKTDG